MLPLAGFWLFLRMLADSVSFRVFYFLVNRMSYDYVTRGACTRVYLVWTPTVALTSSCVFFAFRGMLNVPVLCEQHSVIDMTKYEIDSEQYVDLTKYEIDSA